jgi:hypothetical protein
LRREPVLHKGGIKADACSETFKWGTIRLMEPVTTVTTAWTIAKTAGDISKKLYEFGKNLKDRDAKQHIDEIVDNLRDLKQRASELEEENRDLREKLRFKSDEYEFRPPFYYEKANPDVALCPKCFASKTAGPMGAAWQGISVGYRKCLVCSQSVQVEYSNRLSF